MDDSASPVAGHPAGDEPVQAVNGKAAAGEVPSQSPPPPPPGSTDKPPKKNPGRPKGSKNKTPNDPPDGTDKRRLVKRLDGLLKGPAFIFEATGDEWPAR